MRKGKVCFYNPDNQEIKIDFADWTEEIVDKVVCFLLGLLDNATALR